ncbi:signal peptidase I [Sphaerisporangium rufum]|nr:signal peptidase I [Sphaerisporangium rufum]
MNRSDDDTSGVTSGPPPATVAPAVPDTPDSPDISPDPDTSPHPDISPDPAARPEPEHAAGDDPPGDEPPSGPAGGGRASVRRWESVLLVIGGVVAALLIRTFVLDTFFIPSESMERTLMIDDRVVVNRLSGGIDRGEVVVFDGWDGETTIKRVIGVGGDRVTCCDEAGRVAVNGVPLLEEAYLYRDDVPSQERFDVVVPKGRLWLMGDHRAASQDSRAYRDDEFHGTVPVRDVIGRAVVRYWPFSRVGTLPVPGAFDGLR